MRVSSLGLFLAVFAAFSLATGSHVFAAGEPTVIEKAFATDAGKSALEKAGVNQAKFSEMVAKLTPEQRVKIEGMLKGVTPEARLASRMLATGYTEKEAAARIASLSSDEVAKLAVSDEATASAGEAGIWIAALVVVVVALLIFLYYMAIEDPGTGNQQAEAQPAPVPAP